MRWRARKQAACWPRAAPCAAEGRQQATHESGRIGAASLIGIVLVLLLALRRTRALLAFLPAVAGLAAGTAACIAVFGQIHVLTLVIGTSLLGITIDFPLHWLGKCYGMPAWQADTAMRRVLPGLTVSLSATLVGYLALIFTPFPALTQTAVFSAAGLAIAYGATVLLLPGLMRDWRPRPWPALLHGAAALMTGIDQLLQLPRRIRLAAMLLASMACVAGLLRLDVRDDMRQWLAMPAALIEQARAIGNITGIMPTSQFFLVQAPDTDTLLRRQAELAARLDILVASGTARLRLSQACAPLPRKPARQALATQAARPDAWNSLRAAGVPAAVIEQELRQLSALPSLELRDVLRSPWRNVGAPVVGMGGWSGDGTDHTAGSEFRTSACISGGRTSRRHPVGPRRQAQCAVLRDTPGSRRTESRLLCRRGAADLPVPRTRGHVAHIGRARRRHIAHTGVPGICRAAHHLVLPLRTVAGLGDRRRLRHLHVRRRGRHPSLPDRHRPGRADDTALVWHAGRQRHTGDLELRRHGRNRRTGLPRLRGLDPPA